MADITQKATRRKRPSGGGGEEDAPAQAPGGEAVDEARGAQDEEQQGGGDRGRDGEPTLTSELRDAIRSAAIEVLRPVAREATTAAAKFAVKKGPDVVKDRVLPKVTDAGGAGALAKGALSKGGGVAGGLGKSVGDIAEKVTGKGKGDKGGKTPTGTGRGRRLPVQEFVDVGVDIETVYDQFTQFEEWPRFMHRVERAEQRDDTTVMFHENIWGVRRSWEAEIQEQKPCDRIAWRSKGGTQVAGVATFHRLSDNLTRVNVDMDFQPQGVFEKTASGFRMSRRALRSDLMRFKAYIEMGDEATGSWRGIIEEGEVVEQDGQDEGEDTEARGEEQQDEQYADEEQPEAAEDEQPEGRSEDEEEYADEEEPEETEEPQGYEDEEEPQGSAAEEEPAEEEEPEPEPEPAPRAPRRQPRQAPKAAPRRPRTTSTSRTR